ncbi:MAG: hypothetical protein EXR21_08605 [Flavobacteriaceae bacterium]|nr:hypothetical protein [Flavobacteriaceae bacterium]
MKLIAAFFGLIVLLLTVQPAFALLSQQPDVDCCGGACNTDEAEDETEQTGDEPCCDSNCNPFLSCCCSIGWEVQSISFNFTQLAALIVNTHFAKNNASTGFTPACWQPPTVS